MLDTSVLTVHELRDWMVRRYSDWNQAMQVILTFGSKFGVLYDADLGFDVRFLQNPNVVPELKPLTGNHENVQRYGLANKEAEELLEHLKSFLGIALAVVGARTPKLFDESHRLYRRAASFRGDCE